MPNQHIAINRGFNKLSDAQMLFEDFRTALNVDWQLPNDLREAAQAAINACSGWEMLARCERDSILISLVNSKLGLNKRRFQAFLDHAAETKAFFNYHEKQEILCCFDNDDRNRLEGWLGQKGIGRELSAESCPLSRAETLQALHDQLRSGKVSRSDARNCDASERKEELLRSLFGSYVFHAFPHEALHRYFNANCRMEYIPDFYQHMLRFQPERLHRECALIFLCVDESVRKGRSAEELRDSLYAFVRDSYERLANHCFLAVLIKPFVDGGENSQWCLFSDLILYAEKHIERPLRTGYFKADEIRLTTANHIPELDQSAGKFENANEGFFFRDSFVLGPTMPGDKIGTTSQEADLLLLFDKNERDESVIPCPACRAELAAGNSYPVLGVKSWECQNPICPERSAFDRGNRYSLSSLIKQEAIKSTNDQIPEWSLKKWKLDVLSGADSTSIPDMLLRHFSLHGDRVLFVNSPIIGAERHGRKIAYEQFSPSTTENSYAEFQESSYFRRFIVDRKSSAEPTIVEVPSKFPGISVFHGDCFEVLSAMAADSVDGAVTSPPYYNARSYSEWPNIYSYLYDMYNSARQVFRVLKPGSCYLFNIFDYFDNENNIVLSAMGKKRMILGAYIINLFRRIGFTLLGNVVWYKGEIEGKRNFNQGNRSPYYQFPFNCWEHVLVFRKPDGEVSTYSFPTILAAKPVMKMFNGENKLGHSAPFPSAIPDLLLSQLPPGAIVLDPFSGSMTTGRSATRLGISSISIEKHKEYCELGLRLLEGETPALFQSVLS